MTAPTPAVLTTEQLRAQIKAAHAELSGLCASIRRFTMSIPVQPTDSDIVIGSALSSLSALLDTIDAQAAEIERLRAIINEAGILVEKADIRHISRMPDGVGLSAEAWTDLYHSLVAVLFAPPAPARSETPNGNPSSGGLVAGGAGGSALATHPGGAL